MRNKRLDVLRSIALLLVLAQHASTRTFLSNGGWTGVDLFFVLSGFLISGLLFSEYQKSGSIQFARFFIRRGLKLYPALYVMLFASFAFEYATHQVRPLRDFLVEMLYLRNYLPGLWDHTWSLGVEEHFYLLLPLVLWLMLRRSANRVEPFRTVPLLFGTLAMLCLALRIWRAFSFPVGQPPDLLRIEMGQSQYRIDSLFLGVLLGYLHHFRPGFFAKLNNRRSALGLAMLAAALVSWPYLFATENRFTFTVGFTLLYIGFGLTLLLCLHVRDVLPSIVAAPVRHVGTVFAAIGMYSYSIYLWHGAVNAWLPGLLRRVFHIHYDSIGRDFIYIPGSIVFGTAMSRFIEYPVLAVRDRLFPGGPAPVAAKIIS